MLTKKFLFPLATWLCRNEIKTVIRLTEILIGLVYAGFLPKKLTIRFVSWAIENGLPDGVIKQRWKADIALKIDRGEVNEKD